MKKKKIFFGIVIGLFFVFLLTLQNKPVSAAHTASLSTSGSVFINVAPQTAGVSVSNVTVETTCPTGYILSISGPADTSLYLDGDDANTEKIDASTGTALTPKSLLYTNEVNNIGTWGYSLNSNTVATSSTFVGLTGDIVDILTTNSASAVGGDVIPVYYGASASLAHPAGTYQMANNAGIIYYLTMDMGCALYTISYDGNNADSGVENTVHTDIEENSVITLPSSPYTRVGYRFLGWSNSQIDPDGANAATEIANATIYSPGSLTVTNSLLNASDNLHHVVLYAVWEVFVPAIVSVTGNPTTWTNQSVTLTIVPNYAEMIDKYSFDGGLTWQNSPSQVFNNNQDNIDLKVKDIFGTVSSSTLVDITKIDKTPPTISYSANPLIVTLDESNPISTLITVSDSQSGLDANGLLTYRYVIANARTTDLITDTNYFDYPGLYAISLEVSDAVGNTTTENSQILVRWPTGGKYIVKKTILDGADIAGTGHSSSTSQDGLYQDTSATGADSTLPFASKYYYAGASVDNYISFANTTFRILNVATNNDIKIMGDISDNTSTWGSSSLLNPVGQQIYLSDIYNTWSTKWWPRGQIYNHVTDNNDVLIESKYKLFSNTEKAHVDLATFYAGRVDDNDDIENIILSERTNAERLGGDSASFEGYSAYPNVSDLLKACKAHDIFDSLEDIDTGSVYSTRQQFAGYIWVDAATEFWTMNGRTGTLMQDNDYWTIDSDMGIHFESRGYSLARNYRVALYLTDTTILSGDGSSGNPYTVEEDWTWFDNAQVLQ